MTNWVAAKDTSFVHVIQKLAVIGAKLASITLTQQAKRVEAQTNMLKATAAQRQLRRDAAAAVAAAAAAAAEPPPPPKEEPIG